MESIKRLIQLCSNSLVKKRQNEIVVLTVFNSNGDIVCSQFGAQDGQQERTYIVCFFPPHFSLWPSQELTVYFKNLIAKCR